MAKLVRMEDVLHRRVIGQDDAVTAVSARHPAFARGAVRPEPAHRLVPLPRPDRRREDRAGARARRVPLRRREGDGPHRHVGVPGEAQRVAPHRRAAGVRRLRGGRTAHGGRAAPSVRGRAARRDREGALRRVQRAAPGVRRRSSHRRAGPHGRLHEHRDHHDVEPRRRRRRADGDERGARALQAGVPEPHRRDRVLPPARRVAHRADRRHPGRPACASVSRSATSGSRSPRPRSRTSPRSATTRTSGRGRSSGSSRRRSPTRSRSSCSRASSPTAT